MEKKAGLKEGDFLTNRSSQFFSKFLGYAGGGGKSLSKLLCELLWIRCFVFDGKGQETKVRRFSEFEIQSNSTTAPINIIATGTIKINPISRIWRFSISLN